MPVLNLFPKMKLQKARKVRKIAYAAYLEACERKDSRSIHHAWLAFRDATSAVTKLEAETAR